MIKVIPFSIVGIFVAVLFNLSGITLEQVMTTVGLGEVFDTVTLAKDSLQKAADALENANSR